jgi:hypothetical protein
MGSRSSARGASCRNLLNRQLPGNWPPPLPRARGTTQVQAAGISPSGNSQHLPWMAGIRHDRLGDVGSKRPASQVQAGSSKRAQKLSNSGNRIHLSFLALAALEAKQIAVRVECYRPARTGNGHHTHSAILVNLLKSENSVVGSIFRSQIATGHS